MTQLLMITSTDSSGMDIDVLAAGAQGGAVRPETAARVHGAIKAHFAPELLNRIDDTVIFAPLSGASLRAIVQQRVGDLAKRLEDRGIDVAVDEGAAQQVLRESYNPAFGARPLRRYIERHIATTLSRMLISGALPDRGHVGIAAGAPGSAPGTFTYRVTARAPA